MTKDEFELAFRRYCDSAGASYDPWDIEANWQDYQDHPEEYEYLTECK